MVGFFVAIVAQVLLNEVLFAKPIGFDGHSLARGIGGVASACGGAGGGGRILLRS